MSLRRKEWSMHLSGTGRLWYARCAYHDYKLKIEEGQLDKREVSYSKWFIIQNKLSENTSSSVSVSSWRNQYHDVRSVFVNDKPRLVDVRDLPGLLRFIKSVALVIWVVHGRKKLWLRCMQLQLKVKTATLASATQRKKQIQKLTLDESTLK